MLKVLSLMLLVMSLTACSQKPTTQYIYKKEMVGVPSHLLTPPCVAVRHGSGSVEDLAKAYVYNLSCDRKKTTQLELIKLYNDNIVKIDSVEGKGVIKNNNVIQK